MESEDGETPGKAQSSSAGRRTGRTRRRGWRRRTASGTLAAKSRPEIRIENLGRQPDVGKDFVEQIKLNSSFAVNR